MIFPRTPITNVNKTFRQYTPPSSHINFVKPTRLIRLYLLASARPASDKLYPNSSPVCITCVRYTHPGQRGFALL